MHEVRHLGYADSGAGPIVFPDPADRARFVRADPEEAAARLASIIREEAADVLLSYDPQGGYGHPDHVKVHQVGALAAQMTGTRILEATLPRELVVPAFYPARLLRLTVHYDPDVIRGSYSPRSAITHRVNVRRFAAHKRAALAAHSADARKGRAGGLVRAMIALPVPVFGLFFGHEWFVEPGAAGARIRHDILQADSSAPRN